MVRGNYYIGCCEDLKRRFKQHNAGSVRSTKRFMPWKIVYNETHDTMLLARKRESEIKSWKKRSRLERLIGI